MERKLKEFEKYKGISYSLFKRAKIPGEEWLSLAYLAYHRASEGKYSKMTTSVYYATKTEIEDYYRRINTITIPFHVKQVETTSEYEENYGVWDECSLYELLDGYDDLTKSILELKIQGYSNDEIGKMHGKSRERIRQIINSNNRRSHD